MRHTQPSFLSRHIILILVLLTILGIVVAIITFFSYRAMMPWPLAADPNVWGTFGDFIGGTLNPIFSFLAFLALLITIILQNQELSLSRDELIKSAEALVEQSIALKLQNFESTFFQMIRLHNDIIGEMAIENPDAAKRGLTGRDCFAEYYKNFVSHYDNALDKSGDQGALKVLDEAYEGFTSAKHSNLSHYFRNLYTLVDFVDKSRVENKKHYTNIIRAQLSSFELALLFYNCLWWIGRKKFKQLVEKHALLTNIDISLLKNPKEELPLYEKEAYGDLVIPEQYRSD